MEFRSYVDGDESAIVDLFEKAFGRALAVKSWTWRFRENPAGHGIVELAWDKDVLAGHYAVTTTAMEIDGRPVKTGLSGTTMTHPDYRGQGLFIKLAERTYGRMQENGYAMVWGFPNANSHRGFVRDLQWQDIYELPTLRLQLAEVRQLHPSSAVPVEAAGFDARFDDLWARAPRHARIIAARRRANLDWRYARNPDEKYRILTCADGQDLMGYLVFKRYRDEFQIVDMMFEDYATWGLALVCRVIAMAEAEHCLSVALWCALHDPLHLVLEGLGFRNGEVVTYLGARAFESSVRFAGDSYRGWGLSMGDSDVY